MRKASTVAPGWLGWWFAEGRWVFPRFLPDDLGKGGWVQPCWRDDICATLFLEEDGEPEGELGAVWWSEGRCGALIREGQRP